MGSGEIRVQDLSTVLVVQIKDGDGNVDVSTADILEIYLKDPNGTVTKKTALLNTDGLDGKIKYVVVSGDLAVAGVWAIQGRVIWTATGK